MAGTISLSLSQQFDSQGEPLSGGLLYFYASGTTDPQSAFQDFDLTIEHPWPIVLDASGRVPAFYLDDGFIKIRLTDDTGVTIISADQLLVIGPSSGEGGGGGGVDPNTVLATGDIKARYGTGVLTGFVRCNGNTIGNSVSSATEPPGGSGSAAECQVLFEYLWAFPNITLEGFSKGSGAHQDWLDNRRLILPDLRGRTIAGLDDMGNLLAANRLTATGLGVGISGIILGNAGGTQATALSSTGQLPRFTPAGGIGVGTFATVDGGAHTPSGSAANTGPGTAHTHNTGDAMSTATGLLAAGSTNFWINAGGTQDWENKSTHTHSLGTINFNPVAAHTHGFTGAMDFTGTPVGSTTPSAFTITAPTLVLTFYMKL